MKNIFHLHRVRASGRYILSILRLAGLACGAALGVIQASAQLGGSMVIAPGIDAFTTPAGGGTWIELPGTTIPAGFFDPGSLPFDWVEPLKLSGAPLTALPGIGLADTIVQRLAPATLAPGGSNMVPIEIVALSLVSIAPITVNHGDGTTSEWNVRVCLSSLLPQPRGEMTIRRDTCGDGGTFTATLPVLPKLVFEEVRGTGRRVVDFGRNLPCPPVLNFSIARGHWSVTTPNSLGRLIASGLRVDHDCDAGTAMKGPLPGSTTNFFASVRTDRCITDCDERPLIRKRATTATASIARHMFVPWTLTAGPDADGDGIADDADNCVSVVNPMQGDLDDDGVGDICDNCPTVPNPCQEIVACPACVTPGLDAFYTPGNGGTWQEFRDQTMIPAGFFGPGSEPFEGRVIYRGTPLQGFSEGGEPYDLGQADTLVRRMGDACLVPGGAASVPIQIVALSLQSVQPITVRYVAGPAEQWNVRVHLSSAVPQQPGLLTMVQDEELAGGTFTATFPVRPRLVFTRLGGPPTTRELDLGLLPHIPPDLFVVTNGNWTSYAPPQFPKVSLPPGGFVDHDGNPATPPVGPLEGTTPNFHPGIKVERCTRTTATVKESAPLTGHAAIIAAHSTSYAPPAPPPDRDHDGVPDANDNCPDVPNPDQADADKDGVGDVCDNCPLRYNPCQSDCDGDGIADACEPAPILAINRVGANVILTWRACKEYQIQETTSLNPLVLWRPSNVTVGRSGNMNTVILPVGPCPTFFRLSDRFLRP